MVVFSDIGRAIAAHLEFMRFWRSIPHHGPGRRSVVNLVKPSRYSGSVLRGIRAERGVGRPLWRQA